MDMIRGTLALVVAGAILASACASLAPKAPSSGLIDYKGRAEGASPPAWAGQEARELESLAEFKGMAVFKFEESGKDLAALRRWTAMFSAPSELSSRISIRVRESFDGAQEGDRDSLKTYFSLVLDTISESSFSGYQKYDEWWALRRYGAEGGHKAGSQEYTYYSLYVIPKGTLRKYMAEARDRAALAAKLGPEARAGLERSDRALAESFGGL